MRSHSLMGFRFCATCSTSPSFPANNLAEWKSIVISSRYDELPYWVEGQKDRLHIRRREALLDVQLLSLIVLLRLFWRLRIDAFGEPDTLKGVRPVRRGAVGNVPPWKGVREDELRWRRAGRLPYR